MLLSCVNHMYNFLILSDTVVNLPSFSLCQLRSFCCEYAWQMADLYGLRIFPVGGGEIRGAGSLWICPEVCIINFLSCLRNRQMVYNHHPESITT